MLLTRSVPYPERKVKAADLFTCSRVVWWSLLALFTLVATSCTRAEDEALVDRSFVTGQPCAPPCWYELELDKSGQDETYAALEQLPFIDQASIRETTGLVWLGDEDAKEIYWGCLHPRVKSCGGARLSQGKLKLLWLAVGYDLTFKTVIDQLGPPDYVDYGPYHPEAGGCQIHLMWPQRLISVDSLDKRSDAECQAITSGKGISNGTGVRTIYYSVRETFGPQPGGCCTRIPWPGFTER